MGLWMYGESWWKGVGDGYEYDMRYGWGIFFVGRFWGGFGRGWVWFKSGGRWVSGGGEVEGWEMIEVWMISVL